MGHLLNNQLKWKLLYPLQYINRCQTDQENIKVSIEKCWWCSFRWIKLKAHLTNLFFFSKEKGENFFYVPIEHVIQQAFIGIFRINSWGRRKHFLPFLNMACRKMTPKYFLLRHFWNIYYYKAANKPYSLRSGTFLVVEERRLITDIYVYWMMIWWVKIPFSSS